MKEQSYNRIIKVLNLVGGAYCRIVVIPVQRFSVRRLGGFPGPKASRLLMSGYYAIERIKRPVLKGWLRERGKRMGIPA